MKLFGPTMALLGLLREISMEDIQRQAEPGFAIGVTGPSPSECDTLISLLGGVPSQTPGAGMFFKRLPWPATGGQIELARGIDLLVYVAGAREEVVREDILQSIRATAKGLTPLIVVKHGELPAGGEQANVPSGVFKKTVVLERLDAEWATNLVIPPIVEFLPEHAIALGRWLPPFRRAAAAKVIHDTSWANAQFAVLSNIPALIPVVGNLVAATADFFVLTRNQIVLLIKLAAIYGRDLGTARKIYMEILPVVGAGLLWRTVARELTDLLPVLLGAVPKVLIAFAGTYAVGQTAAYYYDQGRRPPAEMVRSFNLRATELASTVVPGLKANARSLREKLPRLGEGRGLQSV